MFPLQGRRTRPRRRGSPQDTEYQRTCRHRWGRRVGSDAVQVALKTGYVQNNVVHVMKELAYLCPALRKHKMDCAADHVLAPGIAVTPIRPLR